MRLRQPIRDLLLVAWEAAPDDLRRQLPDGFGPLAAGGSAFVAVACFRNRLARLGVLPVPAVRRDRRSHVRP